MLLELCADFSNGNNNQSPFVSPALMSSGIMRVATEGQNFPPEGPQHSVSQGFDATSDVSWIGWRPKLRFWMAASWALLV